MLSPQNRHPQINTERCCSHPRGSFASLKADITKREKETIFYLEMEPLSFVAAAAQGVQSSFISGRFSFAKANPESCGKGYDPRKSLAQ